MRIATTVSVNWAIAIILVGIILFIPLSMGYYHIRDRLIFNFLAADSMYYMSIAHNYATLGIPTMDGEYPTNGFHPLWGYTLMGIFKGFPISHHNQLYVVFLLSIFLVFAAYVLCSYALMRLAGRWPGIIATMALLPGVYSLIFEPRRHSFSEPGLLYTMSPFAAMNGMETPLSLLLWAGFFMSIMLRFAELQKQPGGVSDLRLLFPLPARLCLAALILARLDDILVVGAIGLFILLQRKHTLIEKSKALFAILWPAGSAMAAYCAYNLHTMGVVAPVSVSAKVGVVRGWNILDPYLPIILGYLGYHRWDWWLMAARGMPLLLSLCLGLCAVVYGWPKRSLDTYEAKQSFRSILFLTGLFLVCKSLFLMLYVPILDQGYWYYFSMIAAINVIFALAIALLLKQYPQFRVGAGAFFALVTLFLTPNHVAYMTVYMPQELNYHFRTPGETQQKVDMTDVEYMLWMNGDSIRAYLNEKAPGAKLVENMDGLYAYLLDMPAESVGGFASSLPALQHRTKYGFWRSVVERGFTIVPAFGYRNPYDYPNEVKVTEVIKPPNSPISFVRIELAKTKKP